MVEKLGMKLNSKDLLSILKCSVCRGEYINPTLTKCGHNFCLECIQECIDRNHECPECKRKLTKDNLCKNIQIGRVQRQIEELRSSAKNELVENLLALESGLENNNRNLILSIMQNSLKDQIVRFEQYCENAKKDRENAKRRLKAKYSSLSAKQQTDPQLKIDQEKELHAIDLKCTTTIKYYLKVYAEYIKDIFIGPESLPIMLSVCLPRKDLKLDSVFIAPNKPLKEIKLKIEQLFKDRGDTVIEWTPDFSYKVIEPLTNSTVMIPIEKEMKTLGELGFLHGTRIEIQGSPVCESDIPKPCITLNFRKEDKKAYDYYSCETCSVNWICKPCINQCHKGHSYKDHMKNHIPTWACCYCVKKGCTLPNKKNQMGSIIVASASL